jgi:hypothetical protein
MPVVAPLRNGAQAKKVTKKQPRLAKIRQTGDFQQTAMGQALAPDGSPCMHKGHVFIVFIYIYFY